MGPDSGERCSQCGGPGGDGCGTRAVVDGKTLCLDCWWPTHLADAPAIVEPVIDTIEQKWKDMREVFVAIEEAADSGTLRNPERLPEMRQGFRFNAAILVADSERLKAALPAEAEAFVRRHLGEPPYPSFADIIAEMQATKKRER